MLIDRLKIEVADYLKKQIVKELIAQDHVASGKLLNSVDVAVTDAVDVISIDGRFLKYGKYVDTGTRGGGVVPIDAMIAWMRIKRIDLRGKREIDVANSIRWAIYKKGSPTDGDQRKKRWMSATLENEMNEIIRRIDLIVGEVVTIEFENIIEKWRREFENVEKMAA
jgi:hypothetical protein